MKNCEEFTRHAKTFLLGITLSLASAVCVYAQHPSYEIFALKFADVRSRDQLSVVAEDAPKDSLFDPVFTFWLIRDGAGRNILVDSGFINDLELFDEQYQLRNYSRPDSVLARLGVKPESISDIIITHPHKDHIDGTDLFPKARIWMQKDDFAFFVGGAWQEGREGAGYLKRDVRKIIEANLAGRLVLVDGEKEILPGIQVFTGSRHTVESQWVLVTSNGKMTAIASDNAYTYYNIEKEVSAPSYATFSRSGYVEQIRRMKEIVGETNYILPGHDGLLFTRFPKVADGVVRIR